MRERKGNAKEEPADTLEEKQKAGQNKHEYMYFNRSPPRGGGLPRGRGTPRTGLEEQVRMYGRVGVPRLHLSMIRVFVACLKRGHRCTNYVVLAMYVYGVLGIGRGVLFFANQNAEPMNSLFCVVFEVVPMTDPIYDPNRDRS